MAEPTSKKATMDDAVKGMNMKQLTEKMSDPKTPAPIKAAAKRRLDRISGADKTAPLTDKFGNFTGFGGDNSKKMSKGGKATKKTPAIAISVGMVDAPKNSKGKAAMMRGGMANGKQHMYAAGGMVNDGLKSLKKASPEAYNKITGK